LSFDLGVIEAFEDFDKIQYMLPGNDDHILKFINPQELDIKRIDAVASCRWRFDWLSVEIEAWTD
jgi:hypothetical protein